SETPFRKKLEQVAAENEGKSNEEQEHERGKGSEKQQLLVGVGIEEGKIEGRLRQDDAKHQAHGNREQNDYGPTTAFLRLTNWRMGVQIAPVRSGLGSSGTTGVRP